MLKTSRNAIKHVIIEGGGQFLSFFNAISPKEIAESSLDAVRVTTYLGGSRVLCSTDIFFLLEPHLEKKLYV